MVHDVMHLVALNLCRKLYSRYFNDEAFDLDGLQEKLTEFPFTSGELFFMLMIFILEFVYFNFQALKKSME